MSIILYIGRDIRGDEYEQVWNQLEAEIHLHRHKTVIRACRQNLVSFEFTIIVEQPKVTALN